MCVYDWMYHDGVCLCICISACFDRVSIHLGHCVTSHVRLVPKFMKSVRKPTPAHRKTFLVKCFWCMLLWFVLADCPTTKMLKEYVRTYLFVDLSLALARSHFRSCSLSRGRARVCSLSFIPVASRTPASQQKVLADLGFKKTRLLSCRTTVVTWASVWICWLIRSRHIKEKILCVAPVVGLGEGQLHWWPVYLCVSIYLFHIYTSNFTVFDSWFHVSLCHIIRVYLAEYPSVTMPPNFTSHCNSGS